MGDVVDFHQARIRRLRRLHQTDIATTHPSIIGATIGPYSATFTPAARPGRAPDDQPPGTIVAFERPNT